MQQDKIALMNREFDVENNRNNYNYLLNQVEENKQRKSEFEYREKLYYKPHFGPEETHDLILNEQNRK